jgi:hypothetical protein
MKYPVFKLVELSTHPRPYDVNLVCLLELFEKRRMVSTLSLQMSLMLRWAHMEPFGVDFLFP